MLPKIIIVILFFSVVISLITAFIFLRKDQGSPTSKRLYHWLGIRLVLAFSLIACIIYFIATGQLSNQAPWDQAPTSTTSK